MSTLSASSKYTAKDSLQVLEGLEAVRKRPSMYIGGVDVKGLHHLVWEIVDNSVDEYINDHADTITVTLHKTGDAVTVTDNGRGIPVDIHPKYRKPGLELILTTLHAGGKFGDGRRIHTLRRPARRRHVRRQRPLGKLIADDSPRRLRVAADLPARQAGQRRWRRSGRSAGTAPPSTSSRTPTFSRSRSSTPNLIRAHLEDMSYIHSGLKITFKNDVTKEMLDLSHPGGIPEFLERLINEGQKPKVTEEPFTLARKDGERMEVALQWTEATDERIRSYVNGIRTSSGGTHESGFRPASSRRSASSWPRTNQDQGPDHHRRGHPRGDRRRPVGVRARSAVQGQTKERLNNQEMTAAGGQLGAAGPGNLAQRQHDGSRPDRRPDRAGGRARLASREAAAEVKRKSATQRRLNLPGKLADCKSTDLDETELFIVEGERPAARPSRAATTGRRRCCRCAARSSTPRGCR